MGLFFGDDWKPYNAIQGSPVGFMDTAIVQFQERTGEWMDCGRTQNQQQLILQAERDAQNIHPGKRIRTVDSNGRVLDIFS